MPDLNTDNTRSSVSGYAPMPEFKKPEENAKLNATRTALLHTSIIGLLILAASLWNAENHPDTALFLMVTFVFFGSYTFIGTIETTILRNLIDLRASLIAWIVLFAYFAYVAKAQAVSEINSIFHVDAALLPMTLLAVTVLQVMSLLFWPVIVISTLIVLVAYVWRDDFFGSHGGLAIVITLIISAVAQIIFAGLVWGWVDSSAQRKSTIYRIAHFADFSSSFRCKDLDESKLSVLFVDPAKARVITAPKIPEFVLSFSRKPTWLQPVTIPKEFPQRTCVPYVLE
ncbi:hypothetical protein K5D56_04510 [Pseudomonas cichorii]|nr:hypothetical protein [Pseudomonas cichorii]